MLPRVLEPEVMDDADEAAEYDAMDHAAVNARFAADALAAAGPARAGRWLDVGTGTALIPIELARRDPALRILAVDLAESMLALARRRVAAAGLADRIELDRVDAKGLPYADGSFEAVVSNSIVHHIADPGPALLEMARLVGPGGTLFVRDLARPADRGELDRLVQLHAGGESDRARGLFRASLQAALTVAEVRDLIAPLGLPAEAVAPTSDRHWTLAWRRPAEPATPR